MFPVGGVEVMLALVAGAGLLSLGVAVLLRRRGGWLLALSVAGLLWSLAVIVTVTLIPFQGAPGIVAAEGRLTSCSWDIGGPAPDGFWIFTGGQRLLNTVVFVPSGAFLVLVLTRWRSGWVTVPLGLAALVGLSVLIEWTQLELARLDRACDVTDILDNSAGALLGVLLGLGLAVLLRPWRRR